MIYRYCILILLFHAALCHAELRDPTRPEGIVSTESSGKLVLSAILISKDNRTAVINNRIMHVGDFFSSAQVISIESNKVELMGPDGKITLVLIATPKRALSNNHN